MQASAKKAWRVILAAILASVLCIPATAFGLDGKGDESTDSNGSIAVYVEDSAGTTALLANYSAEEFAELATEVDAGYQYTKSDAVTVLAVKKMVTLEDLFADSGAATYWTEGASLTYICTDGVYTKFEPTYEQYSQTGYFYPNRSNADLENVEDAIEVPTGIAISGWYTSYATTGELSSDALAAKLAELDGTTGDGGLKVAVGIMDNVSGEGVIDAGWRLTGNPISITIHTAAGVTINSINACEISANTQVYTGSPITPVTIEDAEGNALIEGTDYSIVYEDNTNVGTASFTVTGMGSYIGIAYGAFTITDTVLSVQLNGITVKEYKQADLSALLNTTDTLYYQQSNHGSVTVYAATNYITFTDLFADANLSEYWVDGSSIQFICYDGPYGKNEPTYADLAEQIYTYPNQSVNDMTNTEGAVEVPAILSYYYGRQDAGTNTVADAEANAAANMSASTTGKVFRGWAPDSTGAIEAPGWRLATGVLTVNLQTEAASGIFSDVEADSYYEDAVTALSALGVMKGYDNTTLFGVGDSMTRADFVTMLWRYAEPEAYAAYHNDAANTSGMNDVAANTYYTAAINWAVSEGVVNGYTDTAGEPTGIFGTNDPITFEAAIKIIASYADPTSGETDYEATMSLFADGDSVSSWAAPYMAWAVQNSLVTGYTTDDGLYLMPSENIPRERAATIFYRAIEEGAFL